MITWSHAPRTPNATAKDVKDYIFKSTGILMTSKSVISLLKALGFKWRRLLNGYYLKKSMEPWVLGHRNLVVEVLEYLDQHPNWFKVFYQDESAFRTHITQQYGTQPAIIIPCSYAEVLMGFLYIHPGWVSEDNPFHQYDMRVRPGRVLDGTYLLYWLKITNGPFCFVIIRTIQGD